MYLIKIRREIIYDRCIEYMQNKNLRKHIWYSRMAEIVSRGVSRFQFHHTKLEIRSA